MLSLVRKEHSRIRIKTADGTIIWLTVEDIRGYTDKGYNPRVKLIFDAPPDVEILREELLEEKTRIREDDGQPE